MFTLIENILMDNLPKVKRGSGGWLQFDAPCCVHNNETADKRSRGNLLIAGDGSIVYNCYNCKFKTGWRYGNKFLGKKFISFLSWLNISDTEIKDLMYKTRLEFLDNDNIVDYKPKYTKLEFDNKNLPEKSRNIEELLEDDDVIQNQDFADMVAYLYTRGDRLFNLNNYYWTPSTYNKMNRRIIIPFYWNGNIVGYVGRSIDKTERLRYFGDIPSNYIFNTECIKPEHKYIFLVEGPFDALAINGIATLGDKCSPSQVNWLNQQIKYNNKEIIVIPDQEKGGGELLKIAKENEWYVSFPKWEGCKDAADATKKYGYVATVQSILTRMYNSENNITTMKKLILDKK